MDAFDALAHVVALHPRNGRLDGGRRRGTVSFGQRIAEPGGRHWKEWSVDISEAPFAARDLIRRDEAIDLYFSQNAFHGWRRLAQLSTLGALYQDLDYQRRATHAGKDPRVVAEGALAALDETGIPSPSFVMKTGRGLCLVWLHELLPRNALPRWQAVQKRLADILTPFGSDKAALDAARVFRVSGSLNSRADPLDAEVRMIWCNGSVGEPFRHVFSDLADEVLPHTRTGLLSLSAERARRKAEGMQVGGPARTLTVATWAETMLSDLQRLRTHRYPEGAIHPGERDRWLFCAATAMAWLCPHQVLERELSALAHEAAGWEGKETRGRMSSALARARMAAAGQRLEWDGREVDPRYRMKASTVVEWLEIESGEMREAGLRMLVESDRAREITAERQRDSRRRKGAQDRTALQAARLELGRKARFLQVSKGLTVRELADMLGVSAFQVSKAITEANAKG
ncbi:hypothetical protein FJ546_10020 [Mesorhizobium sp. B2-4-19]|uniref:hypothetical protein n=1 Tax=Mesorhizobium sp. B2-4-19 TaxID=2589930 RepID=UPI00112EBEF7|nr:hypothetical protein [Mesorhizobium sp. B2-4-19]TPK65519.1 hypothetical protein FJ546_10020 [Mesorhizobium sp. B2-4-19]